MMLPLFSRNQLPSPQKWNLRHKNKQYGENPLKKVLPLYRVEIVLLFSPRWTSSFLFSIC